MQSSRVYIHVFLPTDKYLRWRLKVDTAPKKFSTLHKLKVLHVIAIVREEHVQYYLTGQNETQKFEVKGHGELECQHIQFLLLLIFL